MSPADFIRAIEHHVCQKNDGHLIRIVGPAFDVVSRWERDGIPLKVALRGIDRYFERYYRNGPRRRPVRVEFCDTDVLEVFDEWRRAVGGVGGGPAGAAAAAASPGEGVPERHAPSLPAHLERVVLKLSNARATGRLGPGADAVIDRVSAELDQARAHARGLRGDARRALIDRLAEIDRDLLDVTMKALPDHARVRIAAEAEDELRSFRDRMAPDAYERAHRALSERRVREDAALPIVSFS